MREDFISLLAITMAITALLTLLQWQSLFPSLRDYMALTGFPVSARQIFLAKFSALVLLFAAFVLSLTGPLAGFFGCRHPRDTGRKTLRVRSSRPPPSPRSPAPVPSSSLLCWPCKACLLNLVPGRWFLRVSLFVQAALFIATVGALPLFGRQPQSAAWWPPVWFVQALGSHRYRTSIGAPRAPGHRRCPRSSPSLSYLLSYHRYRKLLLEAPPDRAGGHWSGLGLAPARTVDPRTRANRPPSPSPGRRSRAAAFTACCCSPTPDSRSAG